MHNNINSDSTHRQAENSCEHGSSALRNYPDVLDINQLSEVLGISTKTGYSMLRSGDIACLKVGRSYRIPKICLIEFIHSAKKQGKTK